MKHLGDTLVAYAAAVIAYTTLMLIIFGVIL
jgi:hypothetical protein